MMGKSRTKTAIRIGIASAAKSLRSVFKKTPIELEEKRLKSRISWAKSKSEARKNEIAQRLCKFALEQKQKFRRELSPAQVKDVQDYFVAKYAFQAVGIFPGYKEHSETVKKMILELEMLKGNKNEKGKRRDMYKELETMLGQKRAKQIMAAVAINRVVVEIAWNRAELELVKVGVRQNPGANVPKPKIGSPSKAPGNP